MLITVNGEGSNDDLNPGFLSAEVNMISFLEVRNILILSQGLDCINLHVTSPLRFVLELYTIRQVCDNVFRYACYCFVLMTSLYSY